MVGMLRAGVAFLAVFLLVGLGQSFAQAQDSQVATTLTAGTSTYDKNANSTQAPANTVWLSSTAAAAAIKAEVSQLQQTAPTSQAQEVDLGVRTAYYTSVLTQLRANTVADAYNASFLQLARIVERYDAGNRPDLQPIRESLLTLLSQ